MKKGIATLILIYLIILSITGYAEIELSAPSAILIDAYSGIVLSEKNADKKMCPASTTKIMTAILTIENANLDDIVITSFNAVNSIDFDSSKLFLSENEQISVKDLLFGLLIASANDAANVLAEHISGSTEEFAKLMNQKAKELGANDSNFVNAHGLYNANHYTTASDLAKIARSAMTLPLFREIVCLRTYTTAATNMFEERVLISTNHLTNPNCQYYCKYAQGIKTGYTSQAGSCLVSYGSHEGTGVISVVLGTGTSEDGKTMSFVDSKKNIEYGLLTLTSQPLVSAGDVISSVPIKKSYQKSALLEAQSNVSAHLPDGVSVNEVKKKEYILNSITAPIYKGDILGRMEYWYGDTKVAETYMIAINNYKKIPLFYIVNPLLIILRTSWSYIIIGLFSAIFIIRKACRSIRHKRKEPLNSYKRKEV